MEFGAVVLIPAEQPTEIKASCGDFSARARGGEITRPMCSPRTPILGNDALHLWMDRVRMAGVGGLWLASDSHDWRSLGSRIADLTRQGIERLLLIKLKAYAEMDLTDLLRFHSEKRSPITDAQDARGSLGVRMLSHSALNRSDDVSGWLCSLDERPTTRYEFRGYTKRLLSSQERQDLVRDALTGGCAMKPVGQQIRDQVWIGEDVVLDDSVRIVGPAYIGPRTVVCPGATIGPFTSVEQDCVIGHGTAIERSSVLPSTDLAPGLSIQQSLVDGSCLENLRWQTVVDLAPAGLARRISHTAFSGGVARARSAAKRANTSDRNQAAGSKPSNPASWVRVQL